MNKFFYISPWILQTAIWIPTRFVLWLFCGLKVKGLENLKDLKPGVVFCSNHVSELDPILVPASLPFLSRFMPIFYTSREKSFYVKSGWRQIFYGGFFFRLWGANRICAGKHNYALSLATHVDIIKNKKSVLIFPEGKRTLTEAERHIHGGVVYLGTATNVPIVPISMWGHASMTFVDFILRRRKVVVEFEKPVLPKELFIGNNPSIENFRHKAELIMDEVFEHAK